MLDVVKRDDNWTISVQEFIFLRVVYADFYFQKNASHLVDSIDTSINRILNNYNITSSIANHYLFLPSTVFQKFEN